MVKNWEGGFKGAWGLVLRLPGSACNSGFTNCVSLVMLGILFAPFSWQVLVMVVNTSHEHKWDHAYKAFYTVPGIKKAYLLYSHLAHTFTYFFHLFRSHPLSTASLSILLLNLLPATIQLTLPIHLPCPCFSLFKGLYINVLMHYIIF